MFVADKIYRREYDRLRDALGGTTHEIVDMFEMERLAHEFYHTRSEGGEGHLEVAKNIYYTVKGIAHMVLSLKPFGCMPSTQSDGAQSAVINHFKDMIYLPIETSGEGEINAHSRVQMALGEAKAKAKSEFKAVVAESGYSLDDLRAGGAPMVPIGSEGPAADASLTIDDSLSEGTLMGKRYVDDTGAEVLVTKAGKGTLSIGSTPLSLKEAKPLPASD